jgi:pyrroline-5-carboxylate reductase
MSNQESQVQPVSPSAVIAGGLANRFPGISVASCNQEVLDHFDTILIAVRPSAARDVLSKLRFRLDHHVVSLVSPLSLPSLSEIEK